ATEVLGEIVIVVAGAAPVTARAEDLIEEVLARASAGERPKDGATQVAPRAPGVGSRGLSDLGLQQRRACDRRRSEAPRHVGAARERLKAAATQVAQHAPGVTSRELYDLALQQRRACGRGQTEEPRHLVGALSRTTAARALDPRAVSVVHLDQTTLLGLVHPARPRSGTE